MPIEIQRHHPDRPEIIDRILHFVAPRGWNANTQFFMVFLGVLAVHLWVAPVLMRSAADLEPGDPQGYFSSHGNEAAASATEVSRAGLDSEDVSNASLPKPVGFEKDKLVLADATIVAKPITETKPEEKIEEKSPASFEPELAPAPVVKAPPAPVKVVGEEKAARPVAPAIESPAESRSVAPETEKAQPRLSDLIVEAPPANRDQAAAAPVPENSTKPSSSPPAKPAASEGMRQFRQLR